MGSVIGDRERKPVDLDIIIKYEEKIPEKKRKSAESWIKNSTKSGTFSEIDPLITHEDEIEKIVSNSRNSKIYSLEKEKFIHY